jgi:ubiquitin-activating enzyme E1
LQYYLTPSHVGKPRAASAVEALAELNAYVKVSVLPEPAITPDVLRRFHVVVATQAPRADLLAWNAACHDASPPVAFLAADVMGVAGFAFSDFGPAHIVRDPNGENAKSAVVVGITKGEKSTVVHTHDTKRHGFDDGDYVVFREVEGMAGLNDGKPRRIANCKAHSFELEGENSSSWPDYTTGGIAEQTKVPVTVAYEPLSARVEKPLPSDDPMGMLLTPDLGKFGRSEQLHVAFQAVELYRAKHGGALPQTRDAAAAAECVEIAREWVKSLAGKAGALSLSPEDVQADVVTKVAMLARTELPALCAFFGGVVAQEVVKYTGKFTPLRQFLYLDAFEVLPEPPAAAAAAAPAASDASSSAGAAAAASSSSSSSSSSSAASPFPPSEFAPSNSRYDHLTAILGRTFQARMMDQRVFVVGAGALGCEFLKNFALMGVGCGPRGRVTVTDMDRIETSNLNRQFLFRAINVGQPKSSTAAAAARVMNPELKVEALETPVGEDTEGTFNDAFWENLDVVTNALDNVKARQYVDSRCVFYGKPLMESGTLGTKANTQVVLPHKTESYSDSQDPPEDSIPMCTLRNFPHAIEHCIEWARDLFQGSFNNTVQEASAFVANPAGWIAKVGEEANLAARRTKLEGALKCIEVAKGASFPMCVELARHLFNANFYLQIRQLLHNFPPDYVDKDTGVKFWSGPKRAPTPAAFDPSDPLHMGFVVDATALIAANYGVKLPDNWSSPAVMGPLLVSIAVPDFVPKQVRIKSGDADTTEEGADDDKQACDAALAKLSAMGESLMREAKECCGWGRPPARLCSRLSFPRPSSRGAPTVFAGFSCRLHVARFSPPSLPPSLRFFFFSPPLFAAAASSTALAGVNLTPAEFEKDDDANHHIAFITAASNLRARNYKIKETTFYEVKMIAGKIIPAIATTTCAVTGLVCIELYKTVAGREVEAMRNSFLNLAVNVYSMGEPGAPKRVKSIAYDPISMGPVRAYPEGFTRWDKLVVRAGDMTFKQLDEWIGKEHKLALSMVTAGKHILYNPGLYKSHREQRSGLRVVDVWKSVTGNAEVPAGRKDLLLDLSVNELGGDGDVVMPRVQYYFE